MPSPTKFFRKLVRQVKEKPANLEELRAWHWTKLDERSPAGQFCFVLEAKSDGDTILVISSKPGNPVKPEYVELLKKQAKDAAKIVQGDYTYKDKTFDFVPNAATKALADGFLKQKDFDLRFWSNFLLDEKQELKIVKFNGKVLQRRSLKDSRDLVIQWNLSRVLTSKKGEILDSEPLPGDWVPDAKDPKKRDHFATPNGIHLPADWPVEVWIEGKMADKAADSQLLQNLFKEPARKLMKQYGDELKTKLLEIEKQAAADKDPKKVKTLAAAALAIESFETKYVDAATAEMEETWCEHIEHHEEYRDYKLNTALKLLKGSLSVGTSLASAAVGGVAGPVAILGLLGTIKSAVELGVDIYNVCRSLNSLQNELDQTLIAFVESRLNPPEKKDKKDKGGKSEKEKENAWSNAGWWDLAKATAERIPGGKGGQAVLAAVAGWPVKPVATIAGDVELYDKKRSGLYVKTTGLAQSVEKVIKVQATVWATLDNDQIKAAAGNNAKYKAKIEELRTKHHAKCEESLKDLFDAVSKNLKDLQSAKEKLTAYKKQIELFQKMVKDDSKAADAIKTFLLPVSDLIWGGIDPGNIPGTLISVSSVALEIGGSAAEALSCLETKEGLEFSKKWLDNAAFLKGVVDNTKAVMPLFGK